MEVDFLKLLNTCRISSPLVIYPDSLPLGCGAIAQQSRQVIYCRYNVHDKIHLTGFSYIQAVLTQYSMQAADEIQLIL